MPRTTRRIAVLLVLALPGALIPREVSARADAYFTKTKSAANVFVAPVPAAIEKVAILPFRAPTELIGSSVSDMFVTEMMRAGRYELVERSQMAKVLGEAELAMAGLSAARAAELGTMMGADGVVIGTVDEYGNVAYRGRTYPVVGITVRLIECSSGKVMWSVDLAKKSDLPTTTLAEHARVVVHEMVAGLYQKWDVQRKVRKVEPARSVDESVGRSAGRPAPKPPPPPDPPEGFEVKDMGLREVTLPWGEPAARARTYRVERAVSADGPFEEIARVSAYDGRYTDSGSRGAPLADDTTYYYRLTSIAADGQESLPTRPRESLTAPPPEPPPSVTAEATASRAVSLTWEPSPSEGVVKYLIERAPAGAPDQHVKVGEVKGTSFSEGGTPDSDLQDSTEYIYWVTAVNRVGAVGAFNQSVQVTTRPPPAPVRGLTADDRQVRCVPLSWELSPEPDVVRYDIYRSDQKGGEFIRIGSVKGRGSTTYLDGGKDPGNLADDRTYFYKVRAVNSVTAEGGDSQVVSATTRAAPPVVEGLAAESARPREVPLSWTPSPDEKVVGYEIERSGDGSQFVSIGRVEGLETTTYCDKGKARKGLGTLEDGSEYWYRVSAFNTANVMSPWCDPVSATTKPAPAKPATPAATTHLPKSVKLSWPANTEPDIDAYVVESAGSAEGRFREIARVPAGSAWIEFTDDDEPDGANRFYRIKAVDADTLESAWSDTSAGATKPLPPAPADVRAELDDEGAKLTWSAPDVPDVREYKVWKKGLLGSELLTTVGETGYRLSSAEIGKKIVVTVSAVDADGLEGPRSAPVEVRPAGVSP